MSEDGTGNSTDLVKLFTQLWETGTDTPDVFAFLAEHEHANGSAAEVLLADQYRRWAVNKEIPVEQYFEKVPDLDEQQKLQLIEEELGYLEDRNQLPPPEEVEKRFSWLPHQLFEQLVESLSFDSHASVSLSSLFGSELRPVELPQAIGRYKVESRIGGGSYGNVYLATDPELDRRVAVKVPRKSRRVRGFEAFQKEARILAQLDHPNIVPVFDFSATDELCYVVSKYVDGCDLAELSKDPLAAREAVELIATVARALYHAHQRGLVHRDVKPSNILIDHDGRAHVADFGLAMRDDEFGSGKGFVGTPAYMSPEQARGEGHRVDGRSDIYSLGIVLYELLVGRRPYRKGTSSELVAQIKSGDLRPPRQFCASIPRVLDRICMKAISRRASERYSTALDFAEDLEAFLAEYLSGANSTSSMTSEARAASGSTREDGSLTGSGMSSRSAGVATSSWGDSTSPTIKIVPQGLRSFGANDADFFLELLPGPRDRFGIPDSLRFWKNRIEATGLDSTFPVGLIYGPSGCGKSSFVRAGLIPLLGERISPIYIESTSTATESQILHSLRQQHAGLSQEADLADSIARLRKAAHRTGQKTLIIIDQFEQWLHGWDNDSDAELVQTLRHCDGTYVQALLMVRDDFWMAVTRFTRELEVPLIENQNSAAVDLFSLSHAERVLHSFGAAFGKLPNNKGELSSDQRQFLASAIAGLAEEKKIVSVRLALFAEMLKDQPWTSETLRSMGGSTGVGLAFLENSFGSNAPPQRKLHVTAARRALESLLPITGTNIKGKMQSLAEIASKTGYEDERDLSELVRILDHDLRLITPTELAADDGDIVTSQRQRRYYQLTHDYLVPSVREWLDRGMKSTRNGRAELMLRDMSQLWNARPETRLLPSLWETLQLNTLTTASRWSKGQRDFMNASMKHHGTRAAWTLLLAAIVGCLCYEGIARTSAKQQVERLLVADSSDVVNVVDLASKPSRWLRNELRVIADDSSRSLKQRTHAAIALLNSDESQLTFLTARVSGADEEQLGLLTEALRAHATEACDHLWTLMDTEERAGRLNAAAALAEFAPVDERWTEHGSNLARDIVSVPSESRLHYQRLKPIASFLLDPLLHEANSDDVVTRRVAAEGVRDYIDSNDDRLLDLIETADAQQFKILMPQLADNPSEFIPELQQRLQGPQHKQWPQPELEGAESISTEVSGLIQSAHGSVNDRFAYWFDMPFERVEQVAAAMKRAKYRPINVRPYPTTTHGLLFASCWLRDNIDWELETAITQEQLESADEKYRQRGLLPDDTASYFVDGDIEQLRSCVVWRSFADVNVKRAFYSGLHTDDHTPEQVRLQKLHMYERSRHLTTTPDGLFLKHSMIWGLDEDNREDGFFYHCPEEEFLIVHRTQRHPTDMAVTRATTDDQKHVYAHYSALWVNRSDRFHGKSVVALDFANHQKAATDLTALGYRPVSVSAAEITAGDWRIASVWHRPFMSTEDGFDVARRQANCIAALLRLGRVDQYVNALSNDDQPEMSVQMQPLQVGGIASSRKELFTELIHVPQSHGCDPALLVTALKSAGDSATQHRLMLALGRFTRNEISTEAMEEVTPVLKAFLQQRSDASTRAAAEWCLRQWGRLNQVSEASEQRSSLPLPRETWYSDLHGHTMHVFDRTTSSEPFVMGCPLSENGAFWEDRQHNKWIHRKFAMSSTEVTVGQFEEFLRANEQFVHIADRDADHEMPATKTSWFLIASYCNWLSKQHDIPEDEWCFQMYGSGDGAPRVSLTPDYVSKLGYRLPTEAEWEFCCRAESQTAYPFGETTNRLNAFAWFADNSDGRPHQVARLMPNEFGMFDMLGNVHEWCMERHESDLTRMRSTINNDHSDQSHVPRQEFRLIRGGSFNSQALSCRSGSREPLHAYKRRFTQGFRIARTLPSDSEDAPKH